MSSSQSSQSSQQKAQPQQQTWAKPPAEELKKRLSILQWRVTQEADTEPPFRNTFWDHHEAGLYVDVVTGEPLFSSRDKFDSGTGWPSFTRPVEAGHVVEHVDNSYGMRRVEVVSAVGASHLGHVFDDGPLPTRKRYCINSASLRFVPAARLVDEGYGAYAAAVGVSGVDADDNNACAVPAPGAARGPDWPGCATTFATVVLRGAGVPESWQRLVGVVSVDVGTSGGARALRVTFTEAELSLAAVVARARAEGLFVVDGGDRAPFTA